MLDVSWQEILVIAVVAVVVIGPKDLPVAIRTVAQWVKKAREMAGEFQRGVDEMVREADLSDVRKQVEQVATGVVDDIGKMADGAIEDVKKSVDPTGEIEKSLQAPETFSEPASLEPSGAPAPVETAALTEPPVDTAVPAPVEPSPAPDPAAPKPPAAA
ncbi:MAG: twin-arginine translocase subunit TatB [Alphaproteobacteria bacterium]|nr:twin-arginine translocase subunit TatB [Alphaproteobacteria bacterium]